MHADVSRRVHAACDRAGRDPADVALLAATKYTDAPAVVHLAALGQRLFGENRVQDARAKLDDIPGVVRKALELHLIGHLQTNKARAAAEIFDMVQSVDSPEIAIALGRGAERAGKRLPVLLQVNVAGDAGKHGFSEEGLLAAAADILAVDAIEVQGLMTIGPRVGTPEEARPTFVALRRLRERLAGSWPANSLRHLSMGMSGDFEVAIEEAATIVRVGTALVGSHH
ncbi:MAG: YggS family pyridoxal phosphate-dependent enzyme [Candidatus Dormibacteria bacterium]